MEGNRKETKKEMTKKIIHWWTKMSFWNKVRSILTAMGAGTEFALVIGEDGNFYKWVVGGATLLAIIITHGVEDKNNNGIADIFEKDDKE